MSINTIRTMKEGIEQFNENFQEIDHNHHISKSQTDEGKYNN